LEKVAYSYRQDPAVPPFDDSHPIVFMDGDCVLCTASARLIVRFDKAGEFRICPVQTAIGRAVLGHYDLDPDDPISWLYLVDGRAYESIDAMIRAGARMGGIGWLLQPLRLLPRSVQDWLYQRIALNRIRLFGRTDICALPDPALQARLMK
jgi:predicted DCC family thiol-disulfide oxidoreductase YuxK